MKKLHTYIGKHWLGYMFAIACMIIAIVLDMIYPMITQSIIDDVILDGKTELLFSLLAGIVIVGVGRSITGYFKEFTFSVTKKKQDMLHTLPPFWAVAVDLCGALRFR